MVLIILGTGVVANNLLPKNKGQGTGWLLINWGWGIGVLAGVYAAWKTGGHLNPAVTIAKWLSFYYDPNVTLNGVAPGEPNAVPVDFTNISLYLIAQFLGAFVGAVIMYLAYKKQFDQEAPAAHKLGVFSTAPEVRSYGWNLVTEAVGTAILIIFVLVAGGTPTAVGPLAVALVVFGIGASLGGPTGYAINPARDLGPRVAHAVLPIPGKGGSDWGYSWVPVVGPIIGTILAVVITYALGLSTLDFLA